MNQKLKGLNPGDRIKVSFEADVNQITQLGGLWVALDGQEDAAFFGPDILNDAPTQVVKIDRPIVAGDLVTGKPNAVNSGRTGTVLSVHRSGVCWIEWNQSAYVEQELGTAFLHDLERAA